MNEQSRYYTVDECRDLQCENGHLSRYPYEPTRCPQPSCSSRSFVPVDRAVAEQTRRAELLLAATKSTESHRAH